jgi:aspartyl-tRNA(Asn)/glutamyl-tRNA(Gln) amidotransferase subunit A
MATDRPTITALAPLLRTGSLTATSLLDTCLGRIRERNGAINAFITVFEESAKTAALEADREIAAGAYRGPLHGVPVSVKDLFDVAGVATTAASKVRKHHVAPRDSTIVRRLREAGAVIIGKTNLHEFALGTTNEDSAYGPVHHPVDLDRTPGGSSGGSGAAVADGMCVASVGTDTGGSIRIPSALCGLVGLKPALGDLPTDGLVPLSSTLDHPGPMCRSVEDAALLYDVLLGSPHPAPLTPAAHPLRLAVPRPYFLAALDPDVAAAFDRVCDVLRAAQTTVVDVAIPHAGEVPAVYQHIVLPEGAAYHARTLDKRPGDYTTNVRLRLEMGRYIVAEDYVRALRARRLLGAEVDAALNGHDALILPTVPIVAPKLGIESVRVGSTTDTVRNATLKCTQLFNITGHPAITLPCGRNAAGLPVGLQIVGARGRTRTLLQVARAVEQTLAAAGA